MSVEFVQLISDCDSALRAGKVSEAARLLKSISPAKVPRNLRLQLAKLCRRCNMPTLGLKLLTPVVYPEKAGISDRATGNELAEFAALRMKIGSVAEALHLLENIKGTEVIEAPLLRAFCHMARWDYAPAAKELREYLSLHPETYPALVARVNLAACLISNNEINEAHDFLNKLIVETENAGYARLRANCLELRSQIYLTTMDEFCCRNDLDAATKILSAENTPDQLYIKKWSAVLDARLSGDVEGLQLLKQEALQRQSWETVREMDFQTLKVKFDSNIFRHLLWGTPFKAYQERVCRDLGQELPSDFFNQYTFGAEKNNVIDLRTGTLSQQGSLNAGKQVHRLLGILLQDFYRPISVGALYADLFPGEYYNVFSSPDRVHQTLRRGRRWIEENKLPISIRELGGQFALESHGNIAFVLGRNLKDMDSRTAVLERIRLALSCVPEDAAGATTFSSSYVSEIAGISPASTVRFLNWAVSSSLIQKHGIGRSTRYSLNSASNNSLRAAS